MLRVRSLNHDNSAYVQFQNQTSRNIDVIWINYSGDFQKYTTLKPRQYINIDTYETHPWIFVDHETGVKMRVGPQMIFFPFSNNDILRRLNQEGDFPIRVPIPISLPLFTLRQISLQNVVNLLKDINDVDALELPQTLKRDIRKFFQEKNETLSKYA